MDKLLKDCTVQPFTAGGPGGQHRNKSQTAVRLTHEPTGIVVMARERRSFAQNLARALTRLQERLDARARVRKPRIATVPSSSAKNQRLQEKHRHGEHKHKRQQRLRDWAADD